MSTLRETVEVRSSANVAFGYDIAGIGSRMLAQLVDALVLAVIVFILVIGAIAVGDALQPGLGQVYGLLIAISAATLGVVAYFTLFEAFTSGRTPGKSAAGLRVIRSDGGAIGFSESLIRNVVRVADMIAFAGAVVMFIDTRSRRLGDLAAGTLVIRERTGVSGRGFIPAAPPVFLRTTNAPGPGIDHVERLGRHELSVLRQFLSRYDLHPEQRSRIAAQMAATLYDRLELDATAPERRWTPELFVERLYLQLEARSGALR